MNTALVAKSMRMSFPVPTNGLDSYIQAVNAIPVLKVDEEKSLAERLREQNDLDAARQLIMAHLRFVVHVARSYSGYGLPLGDLVQEGNVGLMKAVKRFDPEHNVRLVSFAVHWIRAEIHEYVLRNWRIVKVATTKAQRKLFFNLRSSKTRLGWFNQAEAEAVAKDLGVKLATVYEMESRMSGQDMAFDPPENDNDEFVSNSPAAYLRADRADPAELLAEQDWEAQSNMQLGNALERLDERSRDIVQRRWLGENKPTLHELAAEYGVSAERIRQIENNALKKMQVSMSA